MLDVLDILGHFYQGYRMFQDAGGLYLLIDNNQRQEFIELFLVERNLLP